MATLVFSALGTLIGGPVGGLVGALAGRQIDSAILGSGSREGPRLNDLAITTSTFGSAVPRLAGTMRIPGTVIWSTDLVEHSDRQGGGKGRPSVTTYSYTVSLAVALTSTPLSGIGRVWADGQLLRGAAGDLKVGGTLRFHPGTDSQAPDPLIAAAEGAGRCPAFRGIAYVVFEDLQLADFGNRIPVLTFEAIASPGASQNGELSLAPLFAGPDYRVDGEIRLPDVAGLTCDGPLADMLAAIAPVFPLDCDVAGERLVIRRPTPGEVVALPEPAAGVADDSFGQG